MIIQRSIDPVAYFLYAQSPTLNEFHKATMSEESSYFLVPASSGLAIQPKNSGIFTAEIDGSKQQQWYCERENGGKIAFRNAENHLYLRVPGGHKGAKATVGKKQFFTLEPSNTPNAFW